jgi:hypothetical protein
MDIFALVLLAAGLWLHWAAFLAIALLLFARMAKNYRLRRPWLSGSGLNTSRLTRMFAFTFLADLATVVGVFDYLWKKGNK